ncbi:MAG: tol-pal system protein YbgF [Pseudomonadota bacterium]
MEMKRSVRSCRAAPLFAAGILLAVCVGISEASASYTQPSNETGQLLSRINQLENQVQTLSRAVYRGDKNAMDSLAEASSGGGDTVTAAASFEIRMSQSEEQQRNLTGQLEKIVFDLQQMKDRVDRMQADTDQRFGQIERIGDAPPNAAPPPVAGRNDVSGGTLGTLPVNSGDPARELYGRSFSSIQSARYEDAETGFRQFLNQYASHPLAANAQYWLGETYYVRGDYKQAAKSFAQGYQDFPKSAKAEDSLLKLGLSLSRLGRKDDACLSLRQLQKEFQGQAGSARNKAAQEIKQLGCP